jgi:hypothetical protein
MFKVLRVRSSAVSATRVCIGGSETIMVEVRGMVLAAEVERRIVILRLPNKAIAVELVSAGCDTEGVGSPS